MDVGKPRKARVGGRKDREPGGQGSVRGDWPCQEEWPRGRGRVKSLHLADLGCCPPISMWGLWGVPGTSYETMDSMVAHR